MKNIPVLVGTMYCGEGDFEQCKKMVRRQTHDCEHLIIENLSEVEAHLKLYKTFKDSNYQYMLKLDADMVLNDNNTVKNILNRMGDLWRITHYVNDYFTGQKMNGIHMFSRDNHWDFDGFTDGCLKPDRLDVLHTQKKKYRSKQATRGQVMAKHCHYANDKQAFHFGYHSLLKHEHKRLRKFVINYEKNPSDEKLQMVARGALTARNILCYNSYDYNKEFDIIFEENMGRRVLPDRAKKIIESGLAQVRERNK